jgi:hypothetical protein
VERHGEYLVAASQRLRALTCEGEEVIGRASSRPSRMRAKKPALDSCAKRERSACCSAHQTVRALNSTYSSFAVRCRSQVMLFCEIGTRSLA